MNYYLHVNKYKHGDGAKLLGYTDKFKLAETCTINQNAIHAMLFVFYKEWKAYVAIMSMCQSIHSNIDNMNMTSVELEVNLTKF